MTLIIVTMFEIVTENVTVMDEETTNANYRQLKAYFISSAISLLYNKKQTRCLQLVLTRVNGIYKYPDSTDTLLIQSYD
jgi:hypothetical protein